MSDPERYRQAAWRESTTRRYAQVIEHFEGEWGDCSRPPWPASHATWQNMPSVFLQLPCSLTWPHWLAGIRNRVFFDPTKARVVRDVLRGIQAMHPRPPRKAEPLQLQELEVCIQALMEEGLSGQSAVRLRACRDRLLILLEF